MKFSTSALFLFIVSSSVNVVKSQEAEDVFQVVAGCEKDATALFFDNPALGDAWLAWVQTYSYTSTSTSSTASGAVDTVTASYDAGALAAYESACTTVGDSAAWFTLSPTVVYDCVADNDDFKSTETNYGACYPTSEACAEYGQGSSAFISYVNDQMSAVGITCTVDDATAATDTTTASTNGSTSSAAASSMIASFSVATVAAAVGTVMYL